MVKKINVPLCYKDFKCIDVACSDSCCAGWQVDVDEYSWEYYKSVKGSFGDKLHSVMVEIPGEEGQFRLCENGKCPFLQDDWLCEMFSELGEASLCDTCTNYPRYVEDYGEVREMGLAFSCPQAAEMMLSDSRPMEFVSMSIEPAESFHPECETPDEFFISFKDARLIATYRKGQEGYNLQHDTWKKMAQDVLWRTRFMGGKTSKIQEDGYVIETTETFDREYFSILCDCRNVAFYIVQNRDLKMEERVFLYLDYTVGLQNLLDHAQIPLTQDVEGIQEIISETKETYLTTVSLKERISILKQEAEDTLPDARGYELYGESVPKGELMYHLMPEYAAVLYQDLKHCKPQWAPMLEEAENVLHKEMDAKTYHCLRREFLSYLREREYEYEHLMSYFVFKYFLKSYFDDDVYGKAKVGVMGYLMLIELGLCQWVKQDKNYSTKDQAELFHLYSREMEHSEENYDCFYEALQTEDFCNWEHMKLALVELCEV